MTRYDTSLWQAYLWWWCLALQTPCVLPLTICFVNFTSVLPYRTRTTDGISKSSSSLKRSKPNMLQEQGLVCNAMCRCAHTTCASCVHSYGVQTLMVMIMVLIFPLKTPAALLTNILYLIKKCFLYIYFVLGTIIILIRFSFFFWLLNDFVEEPWRYVAFTNPPVVFQHWPTCHSYGVRHIWDSYKATDQSERKCLHQSHTSLAFIFFTSTPSLSKQKYLFLLIIWVLWVLVSVYETEWGNRYDTNTDFHHRLSGTDSVLCYCRLARA